MSDLNQKDPDCICRGNWRLIVKEEQGRIGRRFKNRDGAECVFFGIVYADDDYYYGMMAEDRTMSLLSCVSSIEGFGYEEVGDRVVT